MHLDWGASQFLTKQFQVGLVGYVYKAIGATAAPATGSAASCRRWSASGRSSASYPGRRHAGLYQLKGYKEFAAENRPDGWNTWVTFSISPAAPTPSAPRRMVTK